MRKQVRGRGGAARGLLLLVVALLPLVAALASPRAGLADQPAQDALWAVTTVQIGVCQSPAAPASVSGCFASAVSQLDGNLTRSVATDGVNVYIAGGPTSPGYSCPIADLGANCTEIMAGDWGNGVAGLAAADGSIWIGQSDGVIYKCPNNLPWAQQSNAPSQCVQLDDAVNRYIDSLLLANGRLYVGLSTAGLGPNEPRNQGILWSCDPDTVNACVNFDTYGNNEAYALAVGGGYLWAGFQSGLIWRCDMDTANSCDNWDQAGEPILSLSYNGQGTLYAAVGSKSNTNGVIWSCPTATANSCSNVVTKVSGYSVAAGPDDVFASVSNDGTDPIMWHGSTPYSAYALVNGANQSAGPALLYIPAEGLVGVGGVKVEVGAVYVPADLLHSCRSGGKGPRVQVTVRGPYGMTKSQKVRLCALQGGATVERTFSLLDPGSYVVTARSKKGAYVAHGRLTVEPDTTKTIEVLLAPRKADG